MYSQHITIEHFLPGTQCDADKIEIYHEQRKQNTDHKQEYDEREKIPILRSEDNEFDLTCSINGKNEIEVSA